MSKLIDANKFKQKETVTYFIAQHTQPYVTGFDISAKVYKSFLKRYIVFDVYTKYHDSYNFQPYFAQVLFCAGELGRNEQQKFEYAKFSYDRFQAGMIYSDDINICKSSKLTVLIDLANYDMEPAVWQSLNEVNADGLPSLDVQSVINCINNYIKPPIVAFSPSVGLLYPTITIDENTGNLQFQIENYPRFMSLKWYYNSLATLFVYATNTFTIDSDVEVTEPYVYYSVPVDITLDELEYLQVLNSTSNIIKDISPFEEGTLR